MIARRTKTTAHPAKTTKNDGLAAEMADQVGHDDSRVAMTAARQQMANQVGHDGGQHFKRNSATRGGVKIGKALKVSALSARRIRR